MKERIIEFLKAENKSSAQLAEEIGVQPSGISHILSGRNNPSLDFILKMLEKYKYLSTEWLLFGKGSMYREEQMQTLFEENMKPDKIDDDYKTVIGSQKHLIDIQNNNSKNVSNTNITSEKKEDSRVEKIILFYSGNRFEEYFPNK